MNEKLRRFWRDRGDSTLISTLFVLPLVLGILWSTIDAGIYFSNRSMMVSSARDGARTVAIMGGDGTATTATPLEKKYGQNRSSLCDSLNASQVVATAYNPSTTSNIECAILKDISENSSFVNTSVTAVACDPQQANSISQRTSCVIDWYYGSIPGSVLGVIKKPTEDGTTPGQYDQTGFGGNQRVVGTSESEVALAGISPVVR